MFVPLWLFFLGTGTIMAVVTLVWAMRTNQFEDQDRARFLPLAALSAEELRATPRPRRAARLGIYAVLLCGGLALLGTAVVVLRHV
jgi:nitrogen fixation-related uncharacterized protein